MNTRATLSPLTTCPSTSSRWRWPSGKTGKSCTNDSIMTQASTTRRDQNPSLECQEDGVPTRARHLLFRTARHRCIPARDFISLLDISGTPHTPNGLFFCGMVLYRPIYKVFSLHTRVLPSLAPC